jgi:hypothetical protein
VDASSSPKFLGLLRVLNRHGIDFIVVGGVAALLEGAPILTLDLDVLIDLAPQNLERVMAALGEINAHYRDPAGRWIEPDPVKLATLRMHLLLTDLGALDLLTTIGPGLTLAEVRGRTVGYQLGDEQVRVLVLAAVIEAKEFANRPKDHAVLPVLRETLAAKNRSKTPAGE